MSLHLHQAFGERERVFPKQSTCPNHCLQIVAHKPTIQLPLLGQLHHLKNRIVFKEVLPKSCLLNHLYNYCAMIPCTFYSGIPYYIWFYSFIRSFFKQCFQVTEQAVETQLSQSLESRVGLKIFTKLSDHANKLQFTTMASISKC